MSVSQTDEDDLWLRRERPVAAILVLLQLAGLAVFYQVPEPQVLVWVLGAPLLFALLALSLYDLRYYLLPDVLTLPLIATGLAMGLLPAEAGQPLLWERLAGAAAGYGLLYCLNRAYRAWRGRDGLGMGDAKLLAAAGAWLGLLALPFLLLIAATAGLMAGIGFALLRGKNMGQLMLPFGPFIAASFFLLWLIAGGVR